MWLGKATARMWLAASLMLLLGLCAEAAAGSFATTKHACDFSDRLCQWNATAVFGATLHGDHAFFQGGLNSNDLSTPLNGSTLEILDLRTMLPLVIQVEANAALQSSRYGHQLVVWRGKLLAIGGAVDDTNGSSQPAMSVIALDFSTRTWSSVKQFAQTDDAVIFEAAALSGDWLLLSYLDVGRAGRFLAPLHLPTGDIEANWTLFPGVSSLDWLVALLPVSRGQRFPTLAVQAQRFLPSASDALINCVVVDADGTSLPRPVRVTSVLPAIRSPPGSGGKVLAMSVLNLRGSPHLVMWARSTAVISARREVVSVLLVFSIALDDDGTLGLSMAHLFVSTPLGRSLAGLSSLDLPLQGNSSASAADVVGLPYVGDVELAGKLDSRNVGFAAAGNALVVRGTGRADVSCEPGAEWQPFVLHVSLDGAVPTVRGLSNNTWCETRAAQRAAAEVVASSADLKSDAKLFAVADGEGDAKLLLLSSRVATNPGGQFAGVNRQAPRTGVLVDVARSAVANFSITAPAAYDWPESGIASCLTGLGGRPLYVEAGGRGFRPDTGQEFVAAHGLFALDAAPVGPAQRRLVQVAASSSVPAAVSTALACAPDGRVYGFGGLRLLQPGGFKAGADGAAVWHDSTWAPAGGLFGAELEGSSSQPVLAGLRELHTGKGPAPRSGAALAYLPPATLAQLGMPGGGLLLFGGSDVPHHSLALFLDGPTAQVAGRLANTSWDTSAWLWDLEAAEWVRLAPAGESPPGLMFHSAAVHGQQVMVFGGSELRPGRSPSVVLSTDLWVLDFSERRPRWRHAPVDIAQGAFQFDFPSTGIAPLPGAGLVALKHRSGISLAPIPQTLQAGGDAASLRAAWGFNSLNLTAGDWIRLEPGSVTTLEQPLLLASDITVTGLLAAGGSARQLLQAGAAKPELRCGSNTSSAFIIRSGGAVLEHLTISGCKGAAVDIQVDATGAYSRAAELRNVTLTGHSGAAGAAVRVGPAAWALLSGCELSGNTASAGGVIDAGAGSRLELVDSLVRGSNGSALVFAGERLALARCSFANNSAAAGSNGGALRLLPNQAAANGQRSTAAISNSSFSGNTAAGGGGGALYLGPFTSAVLTRVAFKANTASEGGAVLADRDACLGSMVAAHFSANTATHRGGAVLMRNPSCPNITWSAASFVANSAGGSGGAMHLTEMSQRSIQGTAAVYRDNLANGSAPGSGSGGAIHAGLWSSSLVLSGCRFNGNRATANGGAVNGLAIDSALAFVNSSAAGNLAGVDAAAPTQIARSPAGRVPRGAEVRSEGGALHVEGSRADVLVQGSRLDDNHAGRGGAVSVNSDAGRFGSINSSYANNSAWTAGGAVSVTERKAVTVTGSSFTANLLKWPELAAGGGLYAFLCESVNISASSFSANRAAYGGGAAVLQPRSASQISDTLFEANVALPQLGMGSSPALRHRSLLAKESAFAASAAVLPSDFGPAAALAILGPIGANTTGDSGWYTGGGGLYMSLTSTAAISGGAFMRNEAYNGGGLLARTDACPVGVACHLELSATAVRANTAGAGGGLLITNISASVLRLRGCAAGPSLTLDSSRLCLEQTDNALTRTAGRRRGLLQAAGEEQHGGNAAVQQNSSSGGSRFVVTSAAGMRCLASIRPPAGGEPRYVEEDCGATLYAPPGASFNPAVALFDGLDQPMADGLYDARMPMQVELGDASGAPVNFVVLGATTNAVNGRADFTGLQVHGTPGDAFQLAFRAANGLTRLRQLQLRNCQAGEFTANVSLGSATSITCGQCLAPAFSFYPAANNCSQCSELQRAGAAVCSGPAVVPNPGFYQSHPRNPLLHRCINALACKRDPAAIAAMADWAYLHAPNSTAALVGSPSLVAGYMGLMCAQGHAGPLCGSCQPGYGHAGSVCVRCLPRAANGALYFLVCCIMLVIPAAQMFMHSKSVQKRNEQLQAAFGRASSVVWRHPWAARGAPGESLPAAQPAFWLQPRQAPPKESIAATASPTAAGKQPGLQMAALANGAAADVLARRDQGGSPRQSLSAASPFSAAAVQAPGSTGGLSSGGESADLVPALAEAGPGSRTLRRQQRSALGRMFGTELLDDGARDLWAPSLLPGASPGVSATASSKGADMSASRPAAPAAPANAGPPGSLHSMPADAADAAAAGGVHRRAFKYWHTDVLTMLVNYMQLLGLLRLVRINWQEVVARLLTYLDLTSGASTWASVECSFTATQPSGAPVWPPRSIKRSIVLLLFPVAALLALLAYWAAYAAHLKRRRRTSLAFLRAYLLPHFVMCCGILLYFLYTPTSREIISLFSCQPVDDPAALEAAFPQALAGGQWQYNKAALAAPGLPGAWSPAGYWTSDTAVACGSPLHLGMALGFGVPGLLLFVFGLPIGLALLLRRNARLVDGHSQLEDPTVELMYGLMYDKYRYSCYYWECIILLENCCLTLLLVMLQSVPNPATLQVLVAMAVIFVEAVAHITMQPYACRMLDTLRRAAVYGLAATLFFMMLVTLSDLGARGGVVVAALAIIAAINVGVIGLHLACCGVELHRWLLDLVDARRTGKLTWADMRAFLRRQLAASGRHRWLLKLLGGPLAPAAAPAPGRVARPCENGDTGASAVVHVV